MNQDVDASLPASGSTDLRGLNSSVLSTGSAGSSSMEHAGHVPPTPLGKVGSRRGSGAGARYVPYNNPAKDGEGVGGVEGEKEVPVINLTNSQSNSALPDD